MAYQLPLGISSQNPVVQRLPHRCFYLTRVAVKLYTRRPSLAETNNHDCVLTVPCSVAPTLVAVIVL